MFPSSFVGDKFEISRKKGNSVRDFGGAAGDMVSQYQNETFTRRKYTNYAKLSLTATYDHADITTIQR